MTSACPRTTVLRALACGLAAALALTGCTGKKHRFHASHARTGLRTATPSAVAPDENLARSVADAVPPTPPEYGTQFAANGSDDTRRVISLLGPDCVWGPDRDDPAQLAARTRYARTADGSLRVDSTALVFRTAQQAHAELGRGRDNTRRCPDSVDADGWRTRGEHMIAAPAALIGVDEAQGYAGVGYARGSTTPVPYYSGEARIGWTEVTVYAEAPTAAGALQMGERALELSVERARAAMRS